MTTPNYEVFAIKYAERDARRAEHFIGGDPHDAPMPMDYFVWLIRNDARTILLDMGYTAEVAAKRRRRHLRAPKDGLVMLGVDAATIDTVIISHMHYDHVGTYADFPNAVFHIQDDEMSFVTGRHMRHNQFRHSFEVDDVLGMVRLVYANRVAFHQGDDEIAPGVSVHKIGGHTAGLQSVRVHTARGWVVLASDASHYYEHMETGRCFPTTFHLGQMVEGYATLRGLAESPKHVIPGHDPLVIARYPAPARELDGTIVRLDVMPADES
ncbi:MAG: N-acyl homoserine lactonase family protein [Chloroflexota bacterium]